MKTVIRILLLSFLLTQCAAPIYAQKHLKHFIFFSRDRERIHEASFYSNPGIDGAQITYVWKRLEPKEGEYDFSEIEEDLNFLQQKGKKLFIQIQDASFYSDNVPLPKFMLTDSAYHGGVAQQCVDETGKVVYGGWYAKRWDPAVAAHFHLLLQKLAEKFDGRTEGINLPESSIDICEKKLPEGFTYEAYFNAVKDNMKVLKAAFKKSVPLQYANFMPGPNGTAYLKKVFDYAKEIKIGIGGPDLLVYKPYQMENSYPLIRNISGAVPTGVAVQDGNYATINGKTKRKVTLPEILDFAEHYLKLDYIFWCTEEPYYAKKVLPMLRARKK